ncbi:MAG TPA: RHS repeat-associated core domain-containing protein, partial [Pseudomonadales bacterium]|nr:RHS repeat-associated core domain-containing protein [Pseudomonadales bacterium]
MNKVILNSLVALICLFGSSVGLAETKITYLHNDLLGSPVVATDEQGQVVWRKSYGPFGVEETSEGQSARNPGMGYTGHASDRSTGLVYMGARFYNPQTGVFLSRDPASVSANDPFSFNRYSYVNNNPYRYRDPNGESPLDIGFFVYDAAKFGLAVYSGNPAAITESAMDLGMSAVGLISPVPGTGQALKAVKLAKAIDKAEDGVKLTSTAKNLVKGIKGGESEAAALGRRAHKNYENTLGEGYEFNKALPSGKRPDAIDWENKIVR